jgi:hypothetical protein
MDEIWGNTKKWDWTMDFFYHDNNMYLLESITVAMRILLDLFEAIGKKRFKLPQGWP